MISVFYDGKCSLCRREINHYQKIADSKKIIFIDITEDDQRFTQLGFRKEAGLKLLHVQDDKGQMQIGFNAFLTIWRVLPRWRYLAMLLGLPGVKQLVSALYVIFAKWRFKRNGYDRCDL